MKSLKIALAAALMAVPVAVVAQPTMETHHVVRTDGYGDRTVRTTVVRHENRNWRGDRRDWRGDRRDYRRHSGWDRGRHNGWRNRCGYRWQHGHRVHTCWRVRW